jgi:hypothetical protein
MMRYRQEGKGPRRYGSETGAPADCPEGGNPTPAQDSRQSHRHFDHLHHHHHHHYCRHLHPFQHYHLFLNLLLNLLLNNRDRRRGTRAKLCIEA